MHIYPQGIGINEDGSNEDATAILDIKSTTKGMLASAMTSAQRNDIKTPGTASRINSSQSKLITG